MFRLLLCMPVLSTAHLFAAEEKDPDAELADELLKDLLRPTLSVGLRAAAGYKDNVVLTETNKVRSPFVRADLDAFLWKPPEALTDFQWTLTGSETRYLDAPGDVQDERIWMTQAELRYAIGTYFKAGFSVQGYHQNQVIDLSTSEFGTFRSQLKVNGVSGGPSLRWEIMDPWWFEVSAVWKVENFKGASEDHNEPGAVVRIGRKLGGRHDLSAAWKWRRRDYDDRNAFTVGGRPLPDTTLATRWNQGELRLESKWGASGAWSSTLKGAIDSLRDTAFGFFDYDHWRADAEVKWKSGQWDVRAKYSRGVFDYNVQVVGTGFDPQGRRIVQWNVRLTAERRLSERWTVFGEIEREQNNANDPGGSYKANTGFAGLGFEF